MRKIKLFLCAGLILMNISTTAFAVSDELAKTLPELTLPELAPLQTPALPNDYAAMLDELKRQGFGQTKYDPTKPLPLPELEAPAGAGNTAYDVFKEAYGDVWNDPERQLSNSSAIPNDEFFAAVKSFGAIAQANLASVQAGDKATMAEILKTKLDSSAQWDLEAIKNGNKNLLSASDKAAYLAGTGKPAGWSGIVDTSNKKPTGTNLVAPNPEGWKDGEVYSLLNMAEGVTGGNFFQNASETIKNYSEDIEGAVDETDKITAAVKEKIANGEPVPEEMQEAYKAATKNEVDAKLQPIVDAVDKVGDKQAEWQDEKLTKLAMDISAAEARYGVGNIAFRQNLLGETVVVENGAWFSSDEAPIYLIPKPKGVDDSYATGEGPAAGKIYATFEKKDDGRYVMKPLTPLEAIQSGKIRLY